MWLVFCAVTPRSLVGGYQRFGWTCHHLCARSRRRHNLQDHNSNCCFLKTSNLMNLNSVAYVYYTHVFIHTLFSWARGRHLLKWTTWIHFSWHRTYLAILYKDRSCKRLPWFRCLASVLQSDDDLKKDRDPLFPNTSQFPYDRLQI
jgi:hypothetical protein